MAGHSKGKEFQEFKQSREPGAEFYLGFTEQRDEQREEGNLPYKLEPNVSEIENFLDRLRQEGL